MTVGELLARISSREITEWMVYERIAGPIGPVRGDIHAAQVAATVLNVNRRKRRRPIKIDDVLLRWDRKEPVSPVELYERVRRINARLGGTFKTTDEDNEQ